MPDSGPSNSSSSSSSSSSTAKPKTKLATFMESKYNSKDSSGADATAQFFKDLAATMGITDQDAIAANYIDPVDKYAFEDPYAKVMKKIDYKPSYISPDFEPTFRGTLKQIDSPIYFEQPVEGQSAGGPPVAKNSPPSGPSQQQIDAAVAAAMQKQNQQNVTKNLADKWTDSNKINSLRNQFGNAFSADLANHYAAQYKSKKINADQYVQHLNGLLKNISKNLSIDKF